MITVHDPRDPALVLRFIPEFGNLGNSGGAYLPLASCPGCSTDRVPRAVPMMAVAVLVDLGLYQQHAQLRPPGDAAGTGVGPRRPAVPVEFFEDPGHARDCPTRTPRTRHDPGTRPSGFCSGSVDAGEPASVAASPRHRQAVRLGGRPVVMDPVVNGSERVVRCFLHSSVRPASDPGLVQVDDHGLPKASWAITGR